MPKYKCPNCKRAVDINKEFCPFCSTPNPNIATKTTSSENDDESYFEESMMDDFFEEEMQKAQDEISPADDKLQDEDEIEELYNEDSFSDDFADENIDDENDNYSSTISNSNHTIKREKIKWTDEADQNTASSEEMFNDQGIYNANYDGFYNDTLPKIADEVDNLLKSKEKAILKVAASIVGILAIIVYLTLTL